MCVLCMCLCVCMHASCVMHYVLCVRPPLNCRLSSQERIADLSCSSSSCFTEHKLSHPILLQQDMGASLRLLLAPALPSDIKAKRETERVRALLLLFCGRVLRAAASHRHCFFSGFATSAPRLVESLRGCALASCAPGTEAALVARDALRLLAQIDLWLLSCEISVSCSLVHNCLHGLGDANTQGSLIMTPNPRRPPGSLQELLAMHARSTHSVMHHVKS
jgi:hypothetical protein